MTNNPRRDGSIFVSIASYRDPQCSQTVTDCFARAKNPSRVFVGIVQQNEGSDPDCDSTCEVPAELKGNIRTLKMHASEAKGPTWARYLATLLCDNEEFFFQIDSHTRFAQDWDELAIQDLRRVEQSGWPKVVLSTYPKAFDPDQNGGAPDPDQDTVPHFCRAFFTENNAMISFDGSEALRPSKSGMPRQNAYVAGGLMFSRMEMLRDVPFDNSLPMLFVGEEILLSARLFTHGYNTYIPTKNLVYHYYGREKQPKFWDRSYKMNEVPALQKVRLLLKLDESAKVEDYLADNLDRFGLGRERTLEEFYKWAGIDLNSKTVTRNFCRLENGQKNVDNLSFEATKNPIRKVIEGFATESASEPAFAIVEAFIQEDGQIVLAEPEPYTDEMHRNNVMILLLWLILATMAAWVWYAKRSRF